MAYLGERQQQQRLPQPPASRHPRSRPAPGASPMDQPQQQGVTTSCCLPGAHPVAPHSFTKQKKKSKCMSPAHAPERSCWRDQVLLPGIAIPAESCLLLQPGAAAAALAGPPPHRALPRTVESPLHSVSVTTGFTTRILLSARGSCSVDPQPARSPPAWQLQQRAALYCSDHRQCHKQLRSKTGPNTSKKPLSHPSRPRNS